MNVNLPRWIFASMCNHWQTVATTLALPLYIEGIDEEIALDFQRDSALFRLDGPFAYQGTSVDEWYKLEMMILLTDLVATTTDNAYDIYTWAGVFQGSMLNDTLSIYRYGTGLEDDDSLIGCLQPDPSVKNNVRIANYGMVDKDWRVKQASVNGKFLLCPSE